VDTLEQQRLLKAMLYWKHSRPVFSAPPLYGTLTSDETYLVVPACCESALRPGQDGRVQCRLIRICLPVWLSGFVLRRTWVTGHMTQTLSLGAWLTRTLDPDGSLLTATQRCVWLQSQRPCPSGLSERTKSDSSPSSRTLEAWTTAACRCFGI